MKLYLVTLFKQLSNFLLRNVRITYNEDSNVIMMVTGGASQLRGSEPF